MNSLLGIFLICQAGCQVVGVKSTAEWEHIYLQHDPRGVKCLEVKMSSVRGKTKDTMTLRVNRILCSQTDGLNK